VLDGERTACTSHPSCPLGFGEECQDVIRHAFGLARRGEAGGVAVDILADAAHVIGHDRKPAGHRLEQ
jgi:hypothetical protein